MSQVVLALFVGLFTTFILDFFLFLGIYLHYIKPHEIAVYYNILFADNQNLVYYLLLTLFYAVSLIYIPSKTYRLSVVAFSMALSLFFLIPSISVANGKMILMQEDVRIKDLHYVYKGDIYYNGRTKIYIYDTDVSKMLIINKKEIIE